MKADWISIALAIFGGLGLGGILTTILQARMNQKHAREQRAYEEKREAYINLLKALRDVEVEESTATLKNFALCSLNVELVGSPEVVKTVEMLKESKGYSDERKNTLKSLTIAMREDLGVDCRPIG